MSKDKIDGQIKEEIEDLREIGDHFNPRGWINPALLPDQRRTKIVGEPEPEEE